MWGLGGVTDEGEPDHLEVFDLIIQKRSRSWLWKVCSSGGDILMRGRESSHAAANYQSARALFLLLSVPRTVGAKVPARRRSLPHGVDGRNAAAAQSLNPESGQAGAAGESRQNESALARRLIRLNRLDRKHHWKMGAGHVRFRS